jgi:hypothetical protein
MPPGAAKQFVLHHPRLLLANRRQNDLVAARIAIGACHHNNELAHAYRAVEDGPLDIHILDMVVECRDLVAYEIAIGHDECLFRKEVRIVAILEIGFEEYESKQCDAYRKKKLRGICPPLSLGRGDPAFGIPNSSRDCEEKYDPFEPAGKENDKRAVAERMLLIVFEAADNGRHSCLHTSIILYLVGTA